MHFRYNKKQAWNEVLFSTASTNYDLTFYPESVVLYKYYKIQEHRERFLDEIPEILDHLKEVLSEEEFNEIQKFFFENI